MDLHQTRKTTPDSVGRPSPRLFEEARAAIREQIASGALRAGDKLPSERELADRMNISRPAIREALRTLEMSGVLEFRRGMNGGAFVRRPGPNSIIEPLQDLASLHSATLAELTEVRIALLSCVITLVCERGTEEDLRRLEENVEQTSALFKHGDIAALTASIGDFYDILAAATGNQILASMVGSLGGVVRAIIFKSKQTTLHDPTPSRRKIIRHLRAGRATAAMKVLRAHLLSALAYYSGDGMPDESEVDEARRLSGNA